MAEKKIGQKTYALVYVGLLILTLTTWGVAYLKMGPFNLLAAVAIAIAKASVVVLYFMHVRHSIRLTRIIIGAGLFWLGILFWLTMSDYLTRSL